MGVSRLNLDTTATIVLASTNVIPVLLSTPTQTGFHPETGPAATPVTLASLATFFAANAGPTTTASLTLATATSGDAIVVTGSAAKPAGTVRCIASPNGGSTSLLANALSGGSHFFQVAALTSFTIASTSSAFGAAGAAYAVSGTTTALTADAASGAMTFNANVGTGTGAVGGYIFKVPVTHGSDSVAQTLTTALTMGTGGSARVQVSVGIGVAKAATSTSTFSIAGLPTSSAGLVSGDVWVNSNVLTIVP